MDLQKEYDQLRIEAFKANSAKSEFQKEVSEQVSFSILQKYIRVVLISDGMEYKLNNVDVTLTSHGLTKPPQLSIDLCYFCSSKLPKAKRESLEKIKIKYKNTKNFPYWDNFKIPLSKRLHYESTLEEFSSDNLSLKIN
jgi:hypothetical protein